MGATSTTWKSIFVRVCAKGLSQQQISNTYSLRRWETFTSVLYTCQRDKEHSLVVDSLSAINYTLVSEPLDSFCKIDVYEYIGIMIVLPHTHKILEYIIHFLVTLRMSWKVSVHVYKLRTNPYTHFSRRILLLKY